jgi:hypothetical protein
MRTGRNNQSSTDQIGGLEVRICFREIATAAIGGSAPDSRHTSRPAVRPSQPARTPMPMRSDSCTRSRCGGEVRSI